MRTDYLKQLFLDSDIKERIQKKLPSLFQLAELDSSRAGKIGMEIGSVRERIIIALLMYKFGEENVRTDLPITQAETDVYLFGNPISIKTKSNAVGGIKLIWTVDAQKALQFSKNYEPTIDLLLLQINWGAVGWFYYFPVSTQARIFNKIGRENYIKLPKEGTNPRGVEMTKEAERFLVRDKDTIKIDIKWERGESKHDVYKRWLDLWGD